MTKTNQEVALNPLEEDNALTYLPFLDHSYCMLCMTAKHIQDIKYIFVKLFTFQLTSPGI